MDPLLAKQEEITKHFNVFNEYMDRDKLSLKNAVVLINAAIRNPTFRQNKKLIVIIFNKTYVL